MQISDKKIVFAGLARDIEPFLQQVRSNIEKYAAEFAQWSVILVENDSKDRTKQLLRDWVNQATINGARHAALIELDGLDARHPLRTDRLAFARNQYLKHIADCELKQFDYLAVLDMDAPNAFPTAMENFMAATRFLESRDDVAAVFPNQMPVYCDISALREKDWCPDDCMDEILRTRGQIGSDAAIRKYIFDRQTFIDPKHEPIEVESAFGGIGIYKLPLALQSTYIGLKADGAEVCEHVAFHSAIRATGKKFFILPAFLNFTNFEVSDFGNHHALMPVIANGRVVNLLAARDHPFAALRARFPLYAARFPHLAALYARAHSGSILDIGAGIGESLALCRIAGCNSNYLAVENRDPYYILLSTNALLHRGLFAGHRLVRELAELPGLDDTGIGLIKLDTDDATSFLTRDVAHFAENHPVLWMKALSKGDWAETLSSLSRIYKFVMAFDNFGFAVLSGALDDVKDHLVKLLDDVRDQRAYAISGKIEYLELVFFGANTGDLYEEFRSTL